MAGLKSVTIVGRVVVCFEQGNLLLLLGVKRQLRMRPVESSMWMCILVFGSWRMV